jgi:biotin synthase
MAWANRVRERYKGKDIHLCSIVNAKAGGCPEDCHFCAQSAAHQTGSPRSGLISSEALMAAARQARANGVRTLDLVAAWRGLNEGPMLDEVCQRLEELTREGLVDADASLGLIPSQAVADRLKRAGVVTYNHNLETSRRFFPQICSSHGYEDRVRSLGYLKQAGIRICSGGLIGLGETRADRCDLAFALREFDVDIVPLNALNPVPGTPFENVPPLSPFEILKTIACFRHILPRQDILIAGGRAVNLRDLQCLIFLAGASGLMVGNYLTTPNQPVERDLQMLKDLGLEPRSPITDSRLARAATENRARSS